MGSFMRLFQFRTEMGGQLRLRPALGRWKLRYMENLLQLLLRAGLPSIRFQFLTYRGRLSTLSMSVSMHPIRSPWLFLLLMFVPGVAFARAPKKCVTVDKAEKMLNKDVCVKAHIYDVVRLPDGTRFLDVCSPQTPDAKCRFTIVSLWEDRETVGGLDKYLNEDVRIWGMVRPVRGRAEIQLSHARQFYGGPPKFRPNPLLASGFDAQWERPPVRDPSLRAHGRGRSFMNTRDQQALPAK